MSHHEHLALVRKQIELGQKGVAQQLLVVQELEGNGRTTLKARELLRRLESRLRQQTATYQYLMSKGAMPHS